MIIRNGSMNLICIKGFKSKEAIFIDTTTNELIKASNCIWEELDKKIIDRCASFVEVSWGSGIYGGPVINYLKNLSF
jgi:hypothetical protein